jgi:hypothetical protein
MDAAKFEALSRRLGAAPSRREAVRVLAAAVAVPLVSGLRHEEAAAGLPIVHCKPPGKKAKKSRQCCSGRLRRGHCGCSKKGRPCWAPLEGALCCSQRCQNGKCA